MPRNADGLIEYAQYAESDVFTSGAEFIFGPFNVVGVKSVSLFWDKSYAAGSVVVRRQRSASGPRVADDDILWGTPTTIPATGPDFGEYYSPVDEAGTFNVSSLYRFTVQAYAGSAVKLFWMAGTRNL